MSRSSPRQALEQRYSYPEEWKWTDSFGRKTWERSCSDGAMVRAANGWIIVSRRMDVPARYIRFHYDSFMGTGVSISRDNGTDLVAAGRGVRGGQTARQPAAPSGRRPRADRGSAPRYKGWETGQLPPGVRRPGVPSGGNPPGSGSFHHLSFDDETVRAVSRFRAILVFPTSSRAVGGTFG